jgi:hypothetical protein
MEIREVIGRALFDSGVDPAWHIDADQAALLRQQIDLWVTYQQPGPDESPTWQEDSRQRHERALRRDDPTPYWQRLAANLVASRAGILRPWPECWPPTCGRQPCPRCDNLAARIARGEWPDITALSARRLICVTHEECRQAMRDSRFACQDSCWTLREKGGGE